MEGRPIDLMAWAKLIEESTLAMADGSGAGARVAQTMIDRIIPERVSLLVSTVWLGIDMNFSRLGPPLIFETMVFGDVEELDELQWRWPDRHTALREHYVIVEQVKRSLGFPPELVYTPEP